VRSLEVWEHPWAHAFKCFLLTRTTRSYRNFPYNTWGNTILILKAPLFTHILFTKVCNDHEKENHFISRVTKLLLKFAISHSIGLGNHLLLVFFFFFPNFLGDVVEIIHKEHCFMDDFQNIFEKILHFLSQNFVLQIIFC